MFDSITIIGFGLIGSSLARNIKDGKLSKYLICADRSQDVCDKVDELDLADETTTDLAASVVDADLVILAVPVCAMSAVVRIIGPSLKKGAIITDVGSVKASVVEDISPLFPENTHFVPGHPIAGTEHSGPENGFRELFQDRWCLLTPETDTDQSAIALVQKFWEACGAMVECMDAKHHDRVLGITSHLPHLVAYTLVGTAVDLEDEMQEDVVRFSAGGFRDSTRTAASDPTMWRDIFLSNKDAVLDMLQRFNEDMTILQKAIRKGDGDTLYDWFSRTRHIRRNVIDAKQADPEWTKIKDA